MAATASRMKAKRWGKWGVKSIHKTCNLWAQHLDKSIQDELRVRFA